MSSIAAVELLTQAVREATLGVLRWPHWTKAVVNFVADAGEERIRCLGVIPLVMVPLRLSQPLKSAYARSLSSCAS